MTRNEKWFRVDEYGNSNHIAFEVNDRPGIPQGVVEVTYDLWFDILGTLGFQPEVIPAEILSRLDEPIDDTGIV